MRLVHPPGLPYEWDSDHYCGPVPSGSLNAVPVQNRLCGGQVRNLRVPTDVGDTNRKWIQIVAVRLRLTRVGKKKQPTYRIVAADSRAPRDGRYLQIVGTYDPRREPSAITIDNELAIDWLKRGALPSERVQKLLQVSGVWDEFQASKASK